MQTPHLSTFIEKLEDFNDHLLPIGSVMGRPWRLWRMVGAAGQHGAGGEGDGAYLDTASRTGRVDRWTVMSR